MYFIKTLHFAYTGRSHLWKTVSTIPKDDSGLQSLFDCLRDVKQWMSANFLQLNDSKTEVSIFGSQRFSSQRLSPINWDLYLAISIYMFEIWVLFLTLL